MKLIRLIFSIKNVPTVKWSSTHPLNYKPRFNTLFFLSLGVFLFGLGDAILISSSIGVSPWTVLAQGISNITNLSIGTSTFIISIAILILWIPLKQQPGIGTILNAIIIAAAIDLTLPYLSHPSSYPIQVFQAIIGILVTGLGSGTYLIANLGAGPRDGLMVGLQKKTNMPIAIVRTILEITAVTSGWILGGIVGLGTVLFVFGIGPSIAIGLIVVEKIFPKP
ncbi:MAG: hypothetical protein CL782_07165 [Chloroflexi bacterium]|nr:hypothetical protein [Chloroflexota bacterium]|tara:strand:+ start:420 stop:1088 length:669 start_codon:yes stop_codon:yes gene_type:complete